MAIIFVSGENLASAWECSVLKCWHEGDNVPTQYDRQNDPNSKDCAATIVVQEPFSEPRIHKAFPGGLVDLWKYREEVVNGVHDKWIDPTHGKWTYTYHQRFAAYSNGIKIVNQIESVLSELTKAPYTRRALMITWDPFTDPGSVDPACCQYMWFRVINNKLHCHVHIRSNDAFRAAFMNMFAFTELQLYIAQELSKRIGKIIEPGPYTHFADSFHIYGSNHEQFKGFMQSIKNRPFCDRVFNSTDQIVVESFEQAKLELKDEKR